MQVKRGLESVDWQVAKMVEQGPSAPSLKTSKVSTHSLTTLASGWRWTGIEAKKLGPNVGLENICKEKILIHTHKKILLKRRKETGLTLESKIKAALNTGSKSPLK